MNRLFIPSLALALAALIAPAAQAGGHQSRQVRAGLDGFEEVPAVSTQGRGAFRATLSRDGQELSYELLYADLEGEVAQAHLHLGQRGANGGISIFLCSNLEGAPAGTQACPPSPATISGTVSGDDVIGPEAQGISAGEWDEVVRAIRDGSVYVNVHSDLFPGGEVRGQLRADQRRDRP
jgi:hypothetical protein